MSEIDMLKNVLVSNIGEGRTVLGDGGGDVVVVAYLYRSDAPARVLVKAPAGIHVFEGIDDAVHFMQESNLTNCVVNHLVEYCDKYIGKVDVKFKSEELEKALPELRHSEIYVFDGADNTVNRYECFMFFLEKRFDELLDGHYEEIDDAFYEGEDAVMKIVKSLGATDAEWKDFVSKLDFSFNFIAPEGTSLEGDENLYNKVFNNVYEVGHYQAPIPLYYDFMGMSIPFYGSVFVGSKT